MAHIGHDVLGVDADREKIALLSQGKPPFFEPQLEDLLGRALKAGRLRFSTSLEEAARFGEIHFLAVGTPQQRTSLAADTSHLEAVIDGLAPLLTRACLVVGRSTVPVGTAERLARRLAALAPVGRHAELAWNPEFLREGWAVQDFLTPDRVVVGLSSTRAAELLRSVYDPLLRTGIRYVVTDPNTAELSKVSANAFLATKISFINAMADVCEASRSDVTALADILGLDPRIGHGAMSAGVGYGGGCLPKDVRALIARGTELGVGESLNLLREVDALNTRRPARVVQMVRQMLGGELAGANIAALGTAFKAATDDVRGSAPLAIATALADAGARVRAHDPQASRTAQAECPQLDYVPSPQQACQDADIVLHLTDWPDYAQLDPAELGMIVAQRRIIDARNALALDRWRAAGWEARGMGVPASGALPGGGAAAPAEPAVAAASR
jgi:UDPglucose 6-dehydrogenase